MSKFISRTISLIISVAFIMMSVCSCVRRSEFREGSLKVVCTVYPVYAFASEIAGDKADIKLLVKPGSDAHTWELTTDDMLLLEEADLLIANGANMEPWLDTVFDALENKSLAFCDSSKGMDLLTMGDTTSDLFEEFEEETIGEHEEHDEHGHDHSSTSTDPHTWLSLDNALLASNNILEALCNADPENADIYKANYSIFENKVNALKSEFEDSLSALSGSEIVVSHGAFGYLCNQFDMTQIPVEGVQSESEPDARTISLIIDFIRENGIKTIYYDSIINPSAAAVISEETGCEMVRLRSLGAISKEDFDSGLSYVDAMRENLKALVSVK